MIRRLVVILAFIGFTTSAQQSSLIGNKLSLVPTPLPAFCAQGDLQVDPNNSFRLSICNPTNTWGTVVVPDPTTTLGDMIYNNGAGQTRLPGSTASTVFFLSQTGNGTISAAPAWYTASAVGGVSNLVLRDSSGNISLTAGNFLGNLVGNVTGNVTGSLIGTATNAGTAAFAVLAGTASAATAFVVTPTGCAANQYAQFIGPTGNLTCSTVTTASAAGTASTAGTAAFAAVAGTASAATAFTVTPSACAAGVWANAIGPNGNLTCSTVTTANQAGTAALASTASAINFILNATQGGTGINATPTTSQMLFGNGTNFTVGTIVAGTNMTVSFGGGNVTLAAAAGSGVTSWNFTATTAQPFTAASNAAVNWTSTGNGTILLVTPVGIAGQTIFIKDGGTTLVDLIVSATTGSIVGGGSGQPIFKTSGESMLFMSDGANWLIMDHYCNTGWINFTPTFTGFGTPTAVTFSWERMNNNAHIRGFFIPAAVSATTASFSLPASMTADVTGYPTTNKRFLNLGNYWVQQSGDFGSNNLFGVMLVDTAATTTIFFSNQGVGAGTNTFTPVLSNQVTNGANGIYVDFILPVSGFYP